MPVHAGNIVVNGCAGQFTILAADYVENANPHYEGIQFTNGNIPPNLMDATGAEPCIVHVTGTGGNIFGHTLFWIDPSVGFVHAAAAGRNPVYYIPPQTFDEYCRQNQKDVKQLVPLTGWQPNAAQAYLFTKLTAGFHWHIGKHDCAIFAQQLADAGHATNAGSKSMFPLKAWKRNRRRLGLSVLQWN
jgi:hypothetical protein